MSRQAGQRVGRFELLAVLGRGAQATVWRARDPELDREVALKCLETGADAAPGDDWLAEARLAGGLRHPGIVPVFDVLRDEAGVVIVSECVPGQTLAAQLRTEGPLPPREAVACMRELLDALSHAHAQGVVHRDLKASNVMIDPQGRPRVMDFGIAARLGAAHDGRIVGSPSTISPEAAAGAPPTPAMDVFAAGMLLGEALTGAPLRRPGRPSQALHQALNEPVCWPAESAVEVDDSLRAIVLHATAHDPALRWQSAAEMREALDEWLHPSPDASAPPAHSTLGFLLRRMRLHGDFPALSDAVLRIQRITSSDSESLHALSAEILRDVALTQRLLRAVNTAHFRLGHAGEINTVSRAAALVGFAGIRTMALSLLLLEHMGDRAHAERMKSLFLEALLTATLVDQLTPPSREREEAFLAGMFSHLGRLLAEYYLPEEAQRIRGAPGRGGERVEIDVLGLSYAALGQGVAASWGLPATLRQAMSLPLGEPPRQRVEAPALAMRWRVRAAGELVQALLAGAAAAEPVEEVAARMAGALGLSGDALMAAVQTARVHLAELAGGLGLSVAARAPAARLLGPVDPTLATQPDAGVLDAQAMLGAGIADVAATLAADPVDRGQVLRMVLETLLRAVPFDRVVLALRDPRQALLLGRMALGDGALALSERLRVDLRPGAPPDLFTLCCDKGLDTVIDDARAAGLQPRLPAWCREGGARSFVLLPLRIKGQGVALIYADRVTQPLAPGELTLRSMRTLRDQAVLALKSG